MENGNGPRVKKLEDWKQRGLLVSPKSRKQGLLALDSKNFIEGLGCYGEIRRMVALGKRPSEVARFILEERAERPGVTFNTVKKYVQVYRRFFISPLEVLRARVDSPYEGEARIIRSKLNGLLGKIEEIETLEIMIKAQVKRINDQIEKEKTLGFPLPEVNRSMRELTLMVAKCVEMKMQLGYPGYRAVPVQVNVGGQINVSRIDALSPEDRHELIEFGRMISELMEKAWTKESFESPPEQFLPQ
ncbi:MAG: hypothetical protein IH857_05310 [Deltaproteobacteria bacterium]|nr:hypothetical protein [Deltaproteobacteria bacterium]